MTTKRSHRFLALLAILFTAVFVAAPPAQRNAWATSVDPIFVQIGKDEQTLGPTMDPAWLYRRHLTISNPTTSALSDYQLKVVLNSTNFDFSKAQSGGEDLRFVDSDYTTVLSHWIERYDPVGQSATLFVKVPNIPASTVITIYLYYGNPSAPNTSNGETTFDFFDDFESGSITTTGYFTLSEPQTVMLRDQDWETSVPHTLSVIPAPVGPYAYWGYYGLQDCGGIGMARSDDLRTWDKDKDPLFSGGGERWPSVIKSGSTYYMAHTKDFCGTSYIVLRTSSDGENFSASTILVEQVSGHSNQNPNLFYNPNDNRFYLYWHHQGGGFWEIKVRSATTVEGLSNPASEQILISERYTFAAPNMMYYDGTYYLSSEVQDGSIWKVRIYSSASPTGPFIEITGNPVLTDGSACLFQHVIGDTLHAYYCKFSDGWRLDYRTADLTAGRLQFQSPSPSKWIASGGSWTIENAIQPDGLPGSVLKGVTTANQVQLSSYSGSDYIVEAYGKQIAGTVWGLGIRAENVNNLYSVNLYENLDGNTNLFLYRWVNGGGVEVGSASAGTVTNETWYKLTVKAHTNSLDVYLNDTPMILGLDAQYSSGKVALYGEGQTTAQFDRVLVRKYTTFEPEVSIGEEERAGLGSGWGYRRGVTITNPNAVDLTDYQVKVILTSANFAFGRAQPSGQDLRFTDTDGATLLDYWIESYNQSAQSAEIWVEVPNIPASTTTKMIYLYYSNSTAASATNGDNTFLFFDDFETPGSITSKWTAEGGTWTQETGVQQQDGTGGSVAQGLTTGNQILASSYFGGDYTLEAYAKLLSGRTWGLGAHTVDANNLFSINLYADIDSSPNLYLNRWVNGTTTTVGNFGVGVINTDTWYKITVKMHDSDINIYFNDSFALQRTDAQYPNGKVALYGEVNSTAQFNNVLVRRYAVAEPVAAVGLEAPTALNLIRFNARSSRGHMPLALLLAFALLPILLIAWKRMHPTSA